MSGPPANKGRRARPDAGDRAKNDALLAELDGLYAEFYSRGACWTCYCSTACCHFGRPGREPYVTTIELAAIERARARSGRKLGGSAPAVSKATAPKRSGDRRSLPIAKDERRCPLLDDAGRCSIYDARPFGCRTFFCDRALAGDKVTQRDINAYVSRIRDLAAGFGSGDASGRPLTRAMGC